VSKEDKKEKRTNGAGSRGISITMKKQTRSLFTWATFLDVN